MSVGQQGLIGALAKRIFGATPLDDSDGSEPETADEGRGAGGTGGGIAEGASEKEKLHTAEDNSLKSQARHASPGWDAGNQEGLLGTVASHPVELSPSNIGTPYSSFAGSPENPDRGLPNTDRGKGGLTPRVLQDALDASNEGRGEAGWRAHEQPGREPITLPRTVPAIRTTKPEAPVLTASPTTDIVDGLLGEVVHGRLTKDSVPRDSIARRELNLAQETQNVMPGERPGELKLLSPGKEPVTAAAPPQLSHERLAKHSAFKPDSDEEARQEADKAEKEWVESKQQAGDVRPKVQLQRSQESAQLVVGEKPGEFEVVTAEGEGVLVISEGVPVEAEHLASPTDSTRTLNSALDTVPPARRSSDDRGASSLELKGGGGLQEAALEDAGTPTSRKRSREPEGPFRVAGPPLSAPKTSDAASSPGITPPLHIDAALAPSGAAGPSRLSGAAAGGGEASGEAWALSAAEQAVMAGTPVGNPSGKSQGLTPTAAQVAEAKALAGGKVDPITGHSTLDAGQLGLPANSSELITAAVQSSRPQPVGAFSSSVAVKPTSGKSTDLSNIMESEQEKGDEAVAAAPRASVKQEAAGLAAKQDYPGLPQAAAAGRKEAEVLSEPGMADAVAAAAARLGLQSTAVDVNKPAPSGGADLLREESGSAAGRTVQPAVLGTTASTPSNQALQETGTGEQVPWTKDVAAPAPSEAGLHARPAAAVATTTAEGPTSEVGVDDREPLETVKRETTQAAAAPAIAESRIKDPAFGSAEATGTPTGLDTETTTTVVGSTAAGAAIGGLALLAAGPVAGLAAAGLAGGAALRYMAGTDQETRVEEGAQHPSGEALASAPVQPGDSDGPSSATTAAGKPQSKPVAGAPEASFETQPSASRPADAATSSSHHPAALAAKAALPGSATESADSALQAVDGAPAAGAPVFEGRAAVPDTPEKVAPGPNPASERERVVEGSNAELPERTNGHVAPATGAGNASPKSPSPSPAALLSTFGSRAYPTQIESPASSVTPRGTPRSSLAPVVEPRYVDSAAANAKRAAEAVGLGSLFSPIDQASSSLKRSLAPRPGESAGLLEDWQPSEMSEQAGIGALPASKLSTGSESLLSEAAAPSEHEKAARAAVFDAKVQSGLEEIEQQPEGVEIKTADPPTPTAAKARAVDTPFSNSSPSSAARVSAPYGAGATGAGQPAGSRSLESLADAPDVAQKQSRGRKGSGALVSTGSDEFDAFIDQEARVQRDGKGSRPSSNLPASYKSEDMLGVGPGESAVGDACGDSEQATACESPTKFARPPKGHPASDTTDVEERLPVEQAAGLPVPVLQLGALRHTGEDDKVESPQAKQPVTNVSVSTDGKPLQAASTGPLAEPALVPRATSGDKETEKEAVLPASAPQPLPHQAQQTENSAPAASVIPDKEEAPAVAGIPQQLQTKAREATAPVQETKSAPAGQPATGVATATRPSNARKTSKWMCCFSP